MIQRWVFGLIPKDLIKILGTRVKEIEVGTSTELTTLIRIITSTFMGIMTDTRARIDM